MAEFKPQSVPDPLPQPGGTPVNFDMQPQIDPSYKPPGRFREFYSNNKWYFWSIILGIIIIGVLGYFAFHKRPAEPTKNANVDVTITAPDTAPSGGEVIYKVQIDNHDPTKLVGMSLELVYDDGMNYVSSVPPADGSGGTTFPVPDLASGENAVLIIKTTASGDINEEKRLIARLHYKFQNFNSEFTQEEVHTVRLVAADIVLDATGPDKATNVQSANYDIYYRNDSDKDINGARIQVTFPNEFQFASSNPTPSLGHNIWNLSDLPKNASGKISFSGTFPNTHAGQALVFKIEFLALDANNAYFTQASTTYMTTIDSQPLSVEQKLVSQSANGVVDPGNSVQYEVKYQNNTQVTATGVNIVVEVNSKAIDPANIKADNGLVQGNTITWNASSVPDLEKLNPGQSGKVSFSVIISNPAVKDNSENVTVDTKTRIISTENPSYLNGNDLSVKISSPSSISRSVASVNGPIPPKVGQTTTLQLTVSLRNETNSYQQGVLTGYIPLGVTFVKGSVVGTEAAAVKYDAGTGKITWTVGPLAAHSGSTSPLRTLKFNVSITPTANNAGQPMTLLKNIAFTAKDTFTAQNISINSQELTTDYLPGEGKGRVTQ